MTCWYLSNLRKAHVNMWYPPHRNHWNRPVWRKYYYFPTLRHLFRLEFLDWTSMLLNDNKELSIYGHFENGKGFETNHHWIFWRFMKTVVDNRVRDMFMKKCSYLTLYGWFFHVGYDYTYIPFISFLLTDLAQVVEMCYTWCQKWYRIFY